MDAPEARRFSSSTAERVGLLKTHDNAAKQHQYGTIPDPAEIESILGRDEDTQELGTTAGQEAKLLLKYSVPLMGTYLLQYSFSLVTIFVVGHSKFCVC
jgi:MATE family multidrug resistance protein